MAVHGARDRLLADPAVQLDEAVAHRRGVDDRHVALVAAAPGIGAEIGQQPDAIDAVEPSDEVLI